MSLPKIKLPIYELVQPSTGQKVKFRPFTVKEEKILLIAQESNDFEQVILAIKQIVNNCFIAVNVDKIPMFDLEYMLIALRARSVNNELTFFIPDPDTSEKIEAIIDIDTIELHHDPEHNRHITLSEDTILSLRYPTINEILAARSISKDDKIAQFNLFISVIDTLAVGDVVHKFSEQSKEEIESFVEDLQAGAIVKIKKFFDTMPKLRYEYKYTDNTGKEKTFVLEGTETFFI